MMIAKNLAMLSVVMVLASCHKQHKVDKALTTSPVHHTVRSDSAREMPRLDNSKYYTTEDTVIIYAESGYSLKYGKDEFNRIVDKHPELFSQYPQEPDVCYYSNVVDRNFDSESGRDNYYLLYAYFLKNRNGDGTNDAVRKRLIAIYESINGLFQMIEYGGSYFTHQHYRILAYAEYSVYRYSDSKDNFEKTYDITRQKGLYMQTLRQLIDDESTIDHNTLGEHKMERIKELNKIVEDLDTLITDNFYLRRAQQFHYSYYEYH